MVKRPSLNTEQAAGLFHVTDKTKAGGKDDKVTPKAVGVTISEYEKIKAIATELGVKPHAVMLYAVRDFLRRWDAGERPKTKTRTIVEL